LIRTFEIQANYWLALAAELRTTAEPLTAYQNRNQLRRQVDINRAHDLIHKKDSFCKGVENEANARLNSIEAVNLDLMKRSLMPTQDIWIELMRLGEVATISMPTVMNASPTAPSQGTSFEMGLYAKCAPHEEPIVVWLHMHTHKPQELTDLFKLQGDDFSARHLKADCFRFHGKAWELRTNSKVVRCDVDMESTKKIFDFAQQPAEIFTPTGTHEDIFYTEFELTLH
jgi:hypothetical protein